MIDSFNIGVSSEMIAAGVLIKNGWDMLLPFDRRGKYDLAGIKEGELKKFQVKTASWWSRKDTTSVYLRVQTKSKGQKYLPEDIDYFLFVCPDMRVWMVPIDRLQDYSVVTLDKRVKNARNWSTERRFESEHYLIT